MNWHWFYTRKKLISASVVAALLIIGILMIAMSHFMDWGPASDIESITIQEIPDAPPPHDNRI
jgi:hypothetical protein